MNHRQTAIIKKWINVVRNPETGKTLAQPGITDQLRDLLDMSPRQDMVPVFEHTNYSLKDREESMYHTDDNITKIMANHQLGNSVAELPTQKSKPVEAKADKPTESSVEKSATQKKTEWKDWGNNNSSWSSQSWGSNSWSSNSWNDKNTSDNKNLNKKQKTTSDSEREKKERDWRKKQVVAYTTHYRGILTVITPFPAYFYGINKGTYTSPEPGQHCDPTTYYPIPSGDRPEFGKPHSAHLSNMDQDANMPDKVTSSMWEQVRKQQDEEHRRCSKAALDDARPHYIAKAEADYEARQNDIKRKHAKKATPNDNDDDEAAVTNHGRAAVWVDTWETVLHSFTPKVDKRGNATIAAEGGLALIVMSEDKKIIKYENHSPDMQPESDTKSPIMDEMAVDERIASLNDAVAILTKDADPDSQLMLQNILDVAHIVKKTNKSNLAASSSRPPTEAAPPADDKMGDAAVDPGTEIEEKNRVDLEDSDESEHDFAY